MYNCPMKHAYLIIAHHEFDILNMLIQAIDDERNDIFIHFDKKVRNCPSLTTHYSNLYILEKRIDIRWGHCSQIEAELIYSDGAQPIAFKCSIWKSAGASNTAAK
jgi:hypothetical protein